MKIYKILDSILSLGGLWPSGKTVSGFSLGSLLYLLTLIPGVPAPEVLALFSALGFKIGAAGIVHSKVKEKLVS